MMKIEQVLLLLVMPFYWLCLCNQIFVVSGLCLDDQWPLLLQFKNNFTFIPEGSRLESWNPNHDCCNWWGVTCDKEGHVTGLDLSGKIPSDGKEISGELDNSSSLFSLKHLQKLNLAYNDFNSTNPNHDCCNWLGVTCDKEGHVISIDLSGKFSLVGKAISGELDNSSSLFSLKHLQKLNLAYNDFNSTNPSGFNKLESLTYLNLSHAGFEGQIPIEISQLTRLVALDISCYMEQLSCPNLHKLVQNLTNIRQLYLDGVTITSQGQEWGNALLPLRDLQELSMVNCNLSGPLDSSLSKLENLSVIILDQNEFSSPVPETFANFKNLTTLSLAYCLLTGEFPPKIFQIGTLSVIDLSYNYLQGSFPEFPPSGSLRTIRVSDTSFSGAIPHTIGNMKHLTELDLYNCQFNGTLPNSLSNLTELSYLRFSYNNFTGPMPSFAMSRKLTYLDISNNGLSAEIPSSSHFEGLHNLVSIDLSNNYISGSIPSSLFTLPQLDSIDLSLNKFSSLDEFINVSSSVLNTLDLSNNYLSGPFPAFVFQLSALNVLKLSSNKFNGSLQLDKLSKLKNSTELGLSYNNNQLQGPFQNLTSKLAILDLHNNQLQGPLPIFFKAKLLDFSMNNFSSAIPQHIGNYLSETTFLSLSNNNLHGIIPESLCKASNLQVLDISNNKIYGTIPPCLMNMTSTLRVLNLRMNNLTGIIPDMFPTSCAIRALNLQKNNLYGKIPKSLAHCSELEVLDLKKNQITGGFPCLLKNITTLRVMVLRENKFFGPIGCPKITDTWDMLQIVDLASNKFSGELPGETFTSWMAMMSTNESQAYSEVNIIQLNDWDGPYYRYSVTVTSKGQQMDLVKILPVFTSIDFSSNHFQGEIPKQLFDFKTLYVLNLSNNALSGQIPSSIGNMKQLESLDLSNNSLEGEIPTELASLNFLEVMNLSCNQLSGKIPIGTQIQSFPKTSFINNKGLFGPPLSVNKEYPNNSENIIPPVEECERLACSVNWNILSVEIGFVSGIGILIGTLLFWKKGRLWYWQLVHKILCWIFPQLYLEHVNDRGKSYMVLRWQH